MSERLDEATVRALLERAEDLDAARLEYRELCAEYARAGGLKVGYVTVTPRLMVARDTYHKAADPATIRALSADWLAMRTVLEEVRQFVHDGDALHSCGMDAEDGSYNDGCGPEACWACLTGSMLARLDAVLKGGE